MNDEELRSTIEQVKAQVKAKPENKDKSDDEIDQIILDGFFKAYTEGELTKEDLGAIAQAMGYEFTDEFENDPEAPMQMEPEEKTSTGEGGLPATKEELEDARDIEPGEDVEEFKEDIEDINARKEGGEEEDEDFEEEEEEEESEEEGDDEDAEREEASKLWKMDLRK